MIFEYIYRLQKSEDVFSENTGNLGLVIIPLTDEFVKNRKKYFLQLNKSDTRFCFEIGEKWLKAKNVSVLTNDIFAIVNFLFIPGYFKKNDHYIFFT